MPTYRPTNLSVDVVGFEANSNGRSCKKHDSCGSMLKVDSLVRIRAIQLGEGNMDLACYWVAAGNGADQCRVAFLPKALAMGQTSPYYNGKLLKITEIYSDSESAFKRSKHYRNHGLARAVILEEDTTGHSPPAAMTLNKNKEDDGEASVEDDNTDEEDQPRKKKTKKGVLTNTTTN